MKAMRCMFEGSASLLNHNSPLSSLEMKNVYCPVTGGKMNARILFPSLSPWPRTSRLEVRVTVVVGSSGKFGCEVRSGTVLPSPISSLFYTQGQQPDTKVRNVEKSDTIGLKYGSPGV